MAVTTQAAEYKRLRSYLNPMFKGPKVDAVLNALATNSSYLVNNIQAVNDSLYVTTAQGNYLDLVLSNYGITRDPTIGLSDDVFRTIGIQVKNTKQIRNLINKILDAVFGDEFVKTTSNSQNLEPYALQDGDTLLINFDGTGTHTVTFSASQFTSIAAATAQEVANAISIGLSNLGVKGSAILNNDGNGNYVQLISNTIGASSSITVYGGRAQNVLLFPATVPTAGNFSTQWTISLQPGGNLRFTWTGGANPGVGTVQPEQYVNIYGGGFTSSNNEGTFTVVSASGGAINSSYFEINNPTGSPGIIVQGTDTAVQFYSPIRETILSKSYYAAVYNTEANVLQVFVPATTQVIQRSRIGSAHLHGISEMSQTQLIFEAASNFSASGAGSYYMIGDLGNSYMYYVWFNLGSNTDPAIPGFTGIEVSVSSGDTANTVAENAYLAIHAAVPTLSVSISNNVITIISQTASTVSDNGPSTSTTLGPYIYDTVQGFTISNASTTLTTAINGETGQILNVANSSGFPNSSGYLIINYGCKDQEGPIPYIAAPSSGTLLISPAYFIQQPHVSGASVLLIADKSPIVLPTNGSAYQPYLTDTASGRVYAQHLIDTIVAAGVTVIYTVLYPNDIGLGGWGTAHSEISYVYGP